MEISISSIDQSRASLMTKLLAGSNLMGNTWLPANFKLQGIYDRSLPAYFSLCALIRALHGLFSAFSLLICSDSFITSRLKFAEFDHISKNNSSFEIQQAKCPFDREPMNTLI